MVPRTLFQLLYIVWLANLTRLPIWRSSIFKKSSDLHPYPLRCRCDIKCGPVRAVKNIETSSRQSCKYIALLIKYTTIMVRNRESKGIDSVPYTKYLKYAS